MISTSSSDAEAMANKKILTDITIDLMKSMCKGIAFGQDAILATSGIADIQTVKVLFSSSSTLNLDCGASCQVPTMLVAGSSLEQKYSSYACGEETCSGKPSATITQLLNYFGMIFKIVRNFRQK